MQSVIEEVMCHDVYRLDRILSNCTGVMITIGRMGVYDVKGTPVEIKAASDHMYIVKL